MTEEALLYPHIVENLGFESTKNQSMPNYTLTRTYFDDINNSFIDKICLASNPFASSFSLDRLGRGIRKVKFEHNYCYILSSSFVIPYRTNSICFIRPYYILLSRNSKKWTRAKQPSGRSLSINRTIHKAPQSGNLQLVSLWSHTLRTRICQLRAYRNTPRKCRQYIRSNGAKEEGK
jgi:hypothetical protein